MHLAIGSPTRDMHPSEFTAAYAELYAYTLMRGPWATVTPGFLRSTYIHVGRELYLQAMLKMGATHILWIDTDMDVPRTAACQLVAHDVPIVGCNYKTRTEPGLYTAQDEHGNRIPTTEASRGLESVAALGFGLLLLRLDILQGLPRPLFRHGLNLQNGDVGEDIMFCRTMRAAGHTVYLDHDVSQRVKHVGLKSYPTVPAAALAEVAV